MLTYCLEVIWLIYRLSEGAAWGPNHNILVGGSCSGVQCGLNSGRIVKKEKYTCTMEWCHVSNQHAGGHALFL